MPDEYRALLQQGLVTTYVINAATAVYSLVGGVAAAKQARRLLVRQDPAARRARPGRAQGDRRLMRIFWRSEPAAEQRTVSWRAARGPHDHAPCRAGPPMIGAGRSPAVKIRFDSGARERGILFLLEV